MKILDKSIKYHAEKIMDFEHPTFQGVTNERALTQGVASLAPGYALVGLCYALSAAPQQFKQA